MGLLDALNSRDGVFALGLLDAASAKPVRTSLGGGLLSALSGAQTWQTQQEEKQAREAARLLQAQMMQMQLDEAKRKQAEQQKAAETQRFDESTMTRLLGMPVENRQSMADMGPGEITPNRGVDPMTFLKQGGSMGGLGGVFGLNQALTPAARKTTVSKPGDIARDESGAVLWQNPAEPQKPEAAPSSVREYQFAVSQGYKGTFEQFELSKRKAGATNVGVTYGTPVAAMDAKGNPVFLQPTKDGSPPNIIPGLRPPLSAGEERSAAERAQRERQGLQMNEAMAGAEALLRKGKATGSGAGTVLDAAARAVGVTTAGAQDSARLQALSGWLVANVPRMEGPQSNFDVQNYMTMAGKIGDSTVPIPERLAALETVRKLQGKYAAINGTPMAAPQTGGTDRVRKFNPQTGKIE